MSQKKVLITCGPTWIPIDSVRVLSNQSTGELGHFITEAFLKHQYRVTLIQGPVTHQLKKSKGLRNLKIIHFKFFDQLSLILERELKRKYDIVIHAAAVSDYQLVKQFKGKIDSNQKILTLNLTPTPKLIELIKKIAPDVFLVGFKLGSDFNPRRLIQKAQQLIFQAHCDLVVANSSIQNTYQSWVMDKYSKIIYQGKSRQQLANRLPVLIEQIKK